MKTLFLVYIVIGCTLALPTTTGDKKEELIKIAEPTEPSKMFVSAAIEKPEAAGHSRVKRNLVKVIVPYPVPIRRPAYGYGGGDSYVGGYESGYAPQFNTGLDIFSLLGLFGGEGFGLGHGFGGLGGGGIGF